MEDPLFSLVICDTCRHDPALSRMDLSFQSWYCTHSRTMVLKRRQPSSHTTIVRNIPRDVYFGIDLTGLVTANPYLRWRDGIDDGLMRDV